MPASSATPTPAAGIAPEGWIATVVAGACLGSLWGALETGVRLLYYRYFLEEGRLSIPDVGLLDATGAVVLSAFEMALLGAAIALVARVVLAPVLAVCASRRDAAWRSAFAPRFALLASALFVTLYWYSRFAFDFAYGEPFHSKRRLLLGAGLLVVSLALAGLGAASLVRRPRGVLARARAAGLALLVVLAVFFYSRERLLLESGAKPAGGTVPTNVVLVIVDTLRADHLGCYGYPRPTSPRLDALAKESVVFDRAIAQAPYTWTSFGSIFTGKYPRKHGLLKMDPTQRFNPKRNVTLQQVLDDHGYRTGAFMTGMISNASGLLHGFDTYFEATVGRDVVHRASIWSYFRSELVVHALWNKLRRALNPAIVSDEAIAWIETRKDAPFLSVVHLFSTHTPYDPPPEHDVFSKGYTGPIDRFTTEWATLLEQGKVKLSPADHQRIIDLYDGGVHFADAEIGRVIDVLEQDGRLEDTLLIVTADHGEELGERGLWEHDWMFNTNQHVPLIVRFPRRLGAGIRVTPPVESIDIVPTTLDVLGLPIPEQVDGHSLLPFARGEKPYADDFAFCENNYYESVQNLEWKLVRPRRPDPLDPPRLYHLTSDPLEFDECATREPERVGELTARLDAWVESLPAYKVVTSAASEEVRMIAEQLGYVGADRPREGLHVRGVVSAHVVWTCSDHPDVSSATPGPCPVCGKPLHAESAEPSENDPKKPR